jgi:hypothetical protein
MLSRKPPRTPLRPRQMWRGHSWLQSRDSSRRSCEVLNWRKRQLCSILLVTALKLRRDSSEAFPHGRSHSADRRDGRRLRLRHHDGYRIAERHGVPSAATIGQGGSGGIEMGSRAKREGRTEADTPILRRDADGGRGARRSATTLPASSQDSGCSFPSLIPSVPFRAVAPIAFRDRTTTPLPLVAARNESCAVDRGVREPRPEGAVFGGSGWPAVFANARL